MTVIYLEQDVPFHTELYEGSSTQNLLKEGDTISVPPIDESFTVGEANVRIKLLNDPILFGDWRGKQRAPAKTKLSLRLENQIYTVPKAPPDDNWKGMVYKGSGGTFIDLEAFQNYYFTSLTLRVKVQMTSTVPISASELSKFAKDTITSKIQSGSETLQLGVQTIHAPPETQAPLTASS